MTDLDLFDDQDDEPFELPATLEDEKPGTGSTALYNLLSIVFLVLTVLAIFAVIGLFINPNLPYNVFPPDGSGGAAAVPTEFVIPTLEPTEEPAEEPTLAEASVTPTSQEELAPTDEAPIATAPPEVTPPLEATPLGDGTAAPVPTAPSGQPTVSAFPFTLQADSPSFTQNPEENGGCAALYIVGQVFGLTGEPVDGVAAWVTGENFETPDITKFNEAYGAGSYQILVNNAPIEAEFEVQLWTVQAQALSNRVVVRTRATCEENLIFVNFVQNHEF